MKDILYNAINRFKLGFGQPSEHRDGNLSDYIFSGYSHIADQQVKPNQKAGLKRRLAGILYADVAEYSRLTELDEDGTHLCLVESMRIVKAYIAAGNGRVAHSAGDAILAEFDDAEAALRAAINIQLAARRWNGGLTADRCVLFRIGVHYGDVISDQGDIYGNAVNLAARLEKLACSGGICVSESVRRNLQGHPFIRFVDMGKRCVKNLSEPVEVFWIEIKPDEVYYPALAKIEQASAVTS